jgi:kynureninase
MTKDPLNQQNIGDELRHFGENLAAALRIARSNPDWTGLGEQIAGGLAGLTGALENETSTAGVSAAAQRQELESQYLKQPGPLSQEDARFEMELTTAMRVINASLKEWIDRWKSNQSGQAGDRLPAPAQWQEGHQEVHPDDVSSPPRDIGHEEVQPDDVE